jgi:Zn-dependent M28 family amino/carboxypeptidase
LGHRQVEQYIQKQLSECGPVEPFPFEANGRQHCNWILKLPGSRPGRPPILVGAHFDAAPATPGADDNASGIAVLLELARHFAADPAPSPLWLVAFDLEERGMIGSRAYACFLRQQRQPLRLMLSLEMLGYRDPTPGSQRYPAGLEKLYPNRGDYIGLIGNWPTWGDLLKLQRDFQKVGIPCCWLLAGQRGLILPATRLSDHSPFWDAGYAAVMVTDTAFLRNPHYHKPSDTLETLDQDFLTGVCQGLMAGIRLL